MIRTRAALGWLAAGILATGLINSAQAQIVNDISGNSSEVGMACLGLLLVVAQPNCSYNGGNFTPVPAGSWSGPIVADGYYAANDTPWARAGGPGSTCGGSPEYCSVVGDGKYEPPLTGTVSIDPGAGTACDGDETITANIAMGAAGRSFSGGPGTRGEENWGDGDLSFTLATRTVDRATPNGNDCTYEIASDAFPEPLQIAGGGEYGEDRAVAPGTYVAPGAVGQASFSRANDGGAPGAAAPNVGALMNTVRGPSYTCVLNPGGTCPADGSHHATGGQRAQLQNTLWRVTTDVVGNISSASVYANAEGLQRTFNQPGWDGPVWNFTGSCTQNCNTVPTAVNDPGNVALSTSFVDINILANDSRLQENPGDTVTVNITKDSDNTGDGASCTITPAATGLPADLRLRFQSGGTATGADTCEYTVDTTVNGGVPFTTNAAIVSIDVQADIAVVANALTGTDINTAGVSPASATVTAVNAFTSGGNNPGNTPSTLTVPGAVAGGSVAGACTRNGNNVGFTPAAGSFTGSAICDYTITDAAAEAQSNTVTWNIPDVSPAASNTADTATVGQAKSISIPLTLGNGSAAQHTAVVGTASALGASVTAITVTASAVTLSYNSPAAGNDTFTIDVTDEGGAGQTSSATVSVTVSAASTGGGGGGGGSGLQVPGGNSAIDPWSLLLLLGLPLLRRRNRG